MSSVFTLLDLEFEGCFSYLHPPTKLRLHKLGRVLICGRNGSGKSSIPEVATHILHGQTSPRLKDGKMRDAGIVNNNSRSGYYGKLSTLVGSTQVELLQAHKHATHKRAYKITIDGRDETPLNKPEQKAAVARIVPVTYREWLGTSYLSQNSIHDLLSGKSSDKQEYLTGVFALSIYDDFISVSDARRKELEKSASGAAELQQTIADLKDEKKKLLSLLSKTPSVEKLEKRKKLAERRHRDLADEEAKLREALKNSAKVQAAREAVESAIADVGVDTSELTSEIVAKEEELARLTKKKLKAESVLSSQRKAAKKVAELKKRAERAEKARSGAEKTVKKFRREYPFVVDGRAHVEALADYLIEHGKTIKQRSALDMPTAKKRIEADDPAKHLALFHSAREEHAEVSKLSGVCPICTRELDDDIKEEILRRLEKRSRVELAKVDTALLSKLGEARDYVIESGGISKIPYLLEKIREYERLCSELDDARRDYEEASATLKESSPSLLDEKELEEKVTTLSEKAEKVSRFLKRLRRAEIAVREYAAVKGMAMNAGGEKQLKKRLKKVSLAVEKAKSEYDLAFSRLQKALDVESKLSAIETQLAKVEKRAEREGEKAVELDGLKKYTLPFLKTLRANKVRECVDVVEDVLPIYVDAMFGKTYKGASASLEISDDMKKVDLILKTRSWKKPVSAIQASPGERAKFSLAILGALREVTPRPTNVMFLDEPFNNMESEAKMLFLERMMPLMLERCPGLASVFVIAHDKEILEGPSGVWDDVWWVENTKREGSRVKTGMKLSQLST